MSLLSNLTNSFLVRPSLIAWALRPGHVLPSQKYKKGNFPRPSCSESSRYTVWFCRYNSSHHKAEPLSPIKMIRSAALILAVLSLGGAAVADRCGDAEYDPSKVNDPPPRLAVSPELTAR